MQQMHWSHAKASIPGRFCAPYLTFRELNKILESEMNLVRNYRNWRRYRETVSELSRLSNRELNDLGINRGEILAVAAKAL
jgi:uncharacterized protein YjiS (DUF1127 family)